MLCGFGCIRWLKCGDRMYLFTVGSVLVFVVTQRMGAYWKVMCGMCHVCNVYDCVFVRFQPGSLKPTRMWPRWVSSKPRCASSRRGSPCLSLESLISLPSKFYHSYKKKSLINCWCLYPYIFYALIVTMTVSFELHTLISKWIVFSAGSRVESGRSWSASLTTVWSGWMPALEMLSRPGASATWNSGTSTGRSRW